MAGCLPDIEALAPDDLKGLVLQLLEDVVALKAENAALREEIARLKGLKGPPKLKPSGMEKVLSLLLIPSGAETPVFWALSLPFIPSIAETLEFCITTGYPFRHA